MTQKIRLRSIIVGVVCGLLICAFTPHNNLYLRATLLGGGHFPLAPFFIIVWLTVLTALTARLTKTKPIFSGLELLAAWMLMVLVSGIPYTGLVRTFFINLTAPFQFATVGNRWAETLQPLLPKFLYPRDPETVRLLYDGLENSLSNSWWEILARIPWSGWIVPFLWWGIFILLSYFVMICMVNIFSRQWIENERINFPLLRLPQVMEEAMDEQWLVSFLTNRYLLIGLMIPVFLHTVNGLAQVYPQVPQIPTLFLVGKYFGKYGLFSGFYKMRLYVYPAFIGFAFLASRQISFSLWFFFLLGGLSFGILETFGLSIPSAALGVTFGPTLANVVETQMIGAYGVFFLFIIWLARYHLLLVLKNSVGAAGKVGKDTEWMSLRFSFWGFVVGFLLLAGWCAFFGMNFLMAVIVVGAFLMVSLVASRVICQGGIAYFTLTAAPTDGLIALFGSKMFTSVGIAITAVAQKVLFVDLRESLMPSLFHSSKISEKIGNKRMMLGGIFLVILLGTAVSFAAMLVLTYKYGLRELELGWATNTSLTVYDNVQRLVEAPQGPQNWVIAFTVIGALIMLGLVVCYHRFYWWPIHPIGYLATYSSAMRYLWFSFLVGWLVNQIALRYGGVSLFRKVRFFFFGLILGDFLMGGIWALIGLQTGISYQVLPD